MQKALLKRSSVFMLLIGVLVIGVSMVSCATVGLHAPQASGTHVLHAKNGVIVSDSDYRDYDSFELSNGLRVLVVSDAKADKAGAALNVSVGSGSDPKEFQGLAHFLEHMLFLGTQKYPTSGDYQAFIAKHGGAHNAYTSYTDTNYYFDIDANYLEPALDRFSRFFIDPLFTSEFVDREKNAVHSEYQSNLLNDGRRLYDILKQVINPEHPLAKFSVGSLETLADKDDMSARDAMLRFYKDHYSANLMNLVVVGREDTATLRAMVEEKFGEVKNYERSKLSEGVPFFEEGALPKLVRIKPIQATQTVDYLFPVPNPNAQYERQPLAYIATIVGHEGTGSLLSYLKGLGYAKSLSAGPAINSADEAFFNIGIELTQQGSEHLAEVHNAVFGYLKLLRAEGVDYWRFMEMRTLLRQAFDYKDIRIDAKWVSDVAGVMSRVPVRDVFYANFKAEVYDEGLLWSYIDALNVENALIIVNDPAAETELVSPRFGGQYSFGEFDAALVEPLSAEHFVLPEPNPFIADQKMVEVESFEAPKNISTSDTLSAMYLPNISFATPKAHEYISLISSYPLESAKNQVLASLLAQWALEATNEFSYPAKLAGLDYTFYKHMRGVGLRVMGNSAKLDVLLERLIDTFVNGEISAEHFALVKQAYEKTLINLKHAPLYRQLLDKTQLLAETPSFTPEEQLAACEALSRADLEQFRRAFLEDVYVQMLVSGNVEERAALATKALVEETFAPRVAHDELAKMGVRQVVKDVHFQPEIENNDNGWLNILQAPDESYETGALWALFGHIVNPIFYSELRTNQQLGYIVHAGSYAMNDVPSVLLLVQAPGYAPDEIQKRADAFLKNFAEMLGEMTEAEFAGQKEGLLTIILQKSETLGDLSAKVWGGIDGDYENRAQKLADAISAVKLDDFKAFIKGVADEQVKIRVDYANAASGVEVAPEARDLDVLRGQFGDKVFTGRR